MRHRTTDNDHRDGGSERRSFLPIVAMFATIAAVTLVGPSIVDGLGDRLERPAIESLGTAAPDATRDVATVPAATGDADDAPPPADTSTPSTTPAPSTTPPPGPATPSPTPASVPTSTTALQPVSAIQLVPAMRDVIVRIDGQDIASDADGIVRVPPSVTGTDVEFIGLRAQPALRLVEFGSWSDGDVDAVRNLAELQGPVVEMGLVVSNRVTVATSGPVADGSQIVFASEAGALTISAGQTTWVPASRAVSSAGAFEEQALSYTPVTLTVGAVSTALAPTPFDPSPEALWVIPTDGVPAG